MPAFKKKYKNGVHKNGALTTKKELLAKADQAVDDSMDELTKLNEEFAEIIPLLRADEAEEVPECDILRARINHAKELYQKYLEAKAE